MRLRSSVKMNCPSCKNSVLQPFVEPCCNCRDGSEFDPMTNADRIRFMTNAELAKFFNNIETKDYFGDYLGEIGWLEWLKQEAADKDDVE